LSNNANINKDLIDKISKEFLQTYARGVVSNSELQMGVEVAAMSACSNNNFDPDKFKRALGRVFDTISGSSQTEIDDLYLLHCINHPVNSR
jgi:hypothetical protein